MPLQAARPCHLSAHSSVSAMLIYAFEIQFSCNPSLGRSVLCSGSKHSGIDFRLLRFKKVSLSFIVLIIT